MKLSYFPEMFGDRGAQATQRWNPDLLLGIYRKVIDADGVETGQLLFGKRDDKAMVVTRAMDYPISEAIYNGFHADPEKRSECVARGERDFGLEYVGDWHSHPHRDLSAYPSYPNDFRNTVVSAGKIYICAVAKHDPNDRNDCKNIKLHPWKVIQFPGTTQIESGDGNGFNIHSFSNFSGNDAMNGAVGEGPKPWRYAWDFYNSKKFFAVSENEVQAPAGTLLSD